MKRQASDAYLLMRGGGETSTETLSPGLAVSTYQPIFPPQDTGPMEREPSCWTLSGLIWSASAKSNGDLACCRPRDHTVNCKLPKKLDAGTPNGKFLGISERNKFPHKSPTKALEHTNLNFISLQQIESMVTVRTARELGVLREHFSARFT